MKTSLRALIPLAALSALCAHAAVVTIPQSALTPSTTLYTTDIGLSIGLPLLRVVGHLPEHAAAHRSALT